MSNPLSHVFWEFLRIYWDLYKTVVGRFSGCWGTTFFILARAIRPVQGPHIRDSKIKTALPDLLERPKIKLYHVIGLVIQVFTT